MIDETDESVFDQMKQRYYDREEDDDLELLDPPLIVKLRKEGKLKRSNSSYNFNDTPSPRLKPFFRFSSSRTKVKPINEISVPDQNRTSASAANPDSLLKDYDNQLFKLPQLDRSDSAATDKLKGDDGDEYEEYYENDPFSYMNDTFTFVNQKSPSPPVQQQQQQSQLQQSQQQQQQQTQPQQWQWQAMSLTSPLTSPAAAPIVSPFFSHAQDYPITPRPLYGSSLGMGSGGLGGKDAFPSPAFFAAPSISVAALSEESSSSVFRSRSPSAENAYAPTPGTQTPSTVMPPASEPEIGEISGSGEGESEGNENGSRKRNDSGNGEGENPLSLKYKPFSYYS